MEDNRTESKHIVQAYDVELNKLHAIIYRMGELAGQQLADAITAIVARDADLAERVMAQDEEIDQLERDAEAQTVRLLALRQPVACDLREVVAGLRIANNLERVGDFAKNVAKRSLALQSQPEVSLVRSLRPIGAVVCEMLADVMRAYRTDEVELAIRVRDRDPEVDRAYTGLFRELLTYMMESPQRITACTHLMFAAKNLERIGDHATNIAETLCYRISGQMPEEAREKDDLSAFEVGVGGSGR